MENEYFIWLSRIDQRGKLLKKIAVKFNLIEQQTCYQQDSNSTMNYPMREGQKEQYGFHPYFFESNFFLIDVCLSPTLFSIEHLHLENRSY